MPSQPEKLGLIRDFNNREHGFTGLAVGAAFAGLRPILEFMTFVSLHIDFIGAKAKLT